MPQNSKEFLKSEVISAILWKNPTENTGIIVALKSFNERRCKD